MVATYTTNGRFTKQGSGDNPNTWGRITNAQVIALIDEAIFGVEDVDITGSANVTLTTENGATDQARNATLELTGTLGADIELYVPSVNKQYFIRGSWTGDYTVTVKISGSSTSVTMSSGDKKIVYTNGTDIYEMVAEATNEITTGFSRISFRSSAQSGWVFLQGQTLGDTGSGADLTGTDYQDLYTFFWDNVSDTYCPVSSGRGLSASADWSAGKTITIPDTRDRALFGVGASTWSLGETQGTESLTISQTNLPNVTLSVTGSTSTDGAHTHSIPTGLSGQTISISGNLEADRDSDGSTTTSSSGSHSHTVTGSTEALGSGTALSFLPKGIGVNIEIKL